MSLSRRQFLHNTASAILAGTVLSSCSKHRQPNILWLIAEDFGPDLGCYGTKNIETPNLDRLASEGAMFTNAFTTAPVCSASRSAFMTGMYQTSIDAHNHRSHRDNEDELVLPEPLHVITKYFHDAGYFTSNCAGLHFDKPGKTDWNFTPTTRGFDGTDWRQRSANQPFFAQVNFSQVHRMGIRPKELTVDPNLVELPPYYPDHPITREDWAMYLSATEALDKKIGIVLDRLKEDGLDDNTMIFFFGDNGRNHVRGKQWLYDGGIKVLLIIRWPGHIKPGTIDDSLISAIDFAPSCLDAIGLTPPSHVEGEIFLGPNKKSRDYIVAARDRCDETVDRIRCVRDKHFKYIKNYYPERPYTQYNRYKDAYYPVLRLMQRLHKKNKLTPEQALFMAETRPPEELYDIQNDPFELKNLAGNPDYKDTLLQMRSRLNDWIEKTGDKGQYPEDPEIIQKYKKQMKEWAQDRVDSLYAAERYLD